MISKELENGIATFEARKTAKLGPIGSRIRATMPDGTVREGVLIERGWGGCQPGLRQDDGRTFAIDIDRAEPIAGNMSEWRVRVERAAPRVLEIDFGGIDDYYPEEEITSERRNAWELSEGQWDSAIAEALAAQTPEDAAESLRLASRIEQEWGDDPATQRVAEILAVDYREGT